MNITEKDIRILLGCIAVSMGCVITLPFLAVQVLGGAYGTTMSFVLGLVLLALGAVLLLRGLFFGTVTQWLKLFVCYGILQLILALLVGALAVFALFFTREDALLSKQLADGGSAVLALFLHAWMLCPLGYLCKVGEFRFVFSIRLFLFYLGVGSIGMLLQWGMSRLPFGTIYIILQGVVGVFLCGTLWLMLHLTEKYLKPMEG